MTVKSIRPNQRATATLFVLAACVALAVKACTAQTPARPAPHSQPVAPTAAQTVTPESPAKQRAEADRQTIVRGVRIRNRSGGIVYQGDIDLTESLARIDNGTVLEQFSNDGSVFQNRERRLPEKPRGYYHEWVHQTPKVSGPGPQRIVTGNAGEAYYTADHYKSFRKIRGPAPPATTTKSTISTPVRPEKTLPSGKP